MTMRPAMIGALVIQALLLTLSAGAATASGPHSASGFYHAKDYPACARLYAEQADRTPPVRGAGYDAACCLALAGDREGALERLERTPSELMREHIAEDPDLVSLHDDPRWQALLDRYQADHARANADTRLDKALLVELQRRIDLDQEVRERAMQTPGDKALDAEVAAIDKDNIAWLAQYLDAHGWPGYDTVGRSGSLAFFVLAQHADQDRALQERVLSMLGKAVEKGQASPIHLAYLTDRLRLAQDLPQVYGTQFRLEDGKISPAPIEDPEHVDQRRGALGMSTLAEYQAMQEDSMAARR